MSLNKRTLLYLVIGMVGKIECIVTPCCFAYPDSLNTMPYTASCRPDETLCAHIEGALHEIAQLIPKLFVKYSMKYEPLIADSVHLACVIASAWPGCVRSYAGVYSLRQVDLYQIHRSLEAITETIAACTPNCLCNFEDEFVQLVLVLDTIAYTMHRSLRNCPEFTMSHLVEQFQELECTFDALDR